MGVYCPWRVVFDWQLGPDCEYALWNCMAESEKGESRA
jgi:hypothetical protein